MPAWAVVLTILAVYVAGIPFNAIWYRLVFPKREATSADVFGLAFVWPVTFIPMVFYALWRIPLKRFVKYLDKVKERQLRSG